MWSKKLIKRLTIVWLISLVCFSCEKRANFKIERRLFNLDKNKRDIQICLSINDKLDTCFSLYLKSDTNFKTLRQNFIDLKSDICIIDRVLYSVDSNLGQNNAKLDFSIYNNVLKKLYDNGITLSKNEQRQLLLKCNILLDAENSFDVYFYPDNTALEKIDSIYRFHFIRTKDTTSNYIDDRWWFCYDFFVLRTIGYILLNPNKQEFIIFSKKHYVNYIFISYSMDKSGFLTHLELMNPTSVLTPIGGL